jgi:hypothetical protein
VWGSQDQQTPYPMRLGGGHWQRRSHVTSADAKPSDHAPGKHLKNIIIFRVSTGVFNFKNSYSGVRFDNKKLFGFGQTSHSGSRFNNFFEILNRYVGSHADDFIAREAVDGLIGDIHLKISREKLAFLNVK